MSRFDPALSDLYRSLRRLESDDQVRDFLTDLCTPTELQCICDRWTVAKLLHMGFSYRVIMEKTGASTATIARLRKTLLAGSGALQTVCQRRQEILDQTLPPHA